MKQVFLIRKRVKAKKSLVRKIVRIKSAMSRKPSIKLTVNHCATGVCSTRSRARASMACIAMDLRTRNYRHLISDRKVQNIRNMRRGHLLRKDRHSDWFRFFNEINSFYCNSEATNKKYFQYLYYFTHINLIIHNLHFLAVNCG